LRAEAQRHGVQVSVLCPGVIRTPILTGGQYGRIQLAGVSEEELLKKFWDPLRGRWAPECSPSVPEQRQLDLLRGNVDLVVLARYMQILTPRFLADVGVP
jgi:hypothetical protein